MKFNKEMIYLFDNNLVVLKKEKVSYMFRGLSKYLCSFIFLSFFSVSLTACSSEYDADNTDYSEKNEEDRDYVKEYDEKR